MKLKLLHFIADDEYLIVKDSQSAALMNGISYYKSLKSLLYDFKDYLYRHNIVWGIRYSYHHNKNYEVLGEFDFREDLLNKFAEFLI